MKVRELSQELQEKAKVELNEDPCKVKDGLKSIREWLKFQKHLKYKDEDQFLLAFLRGCKFSLETVKQKLDNYYTSRTLSPEIFKGRNPFKQSMQLILNNTKFFITPETFPLICYFAWAEVERNNISLNDLAQHTFMGLDLLMNEDDAFVINGMILILDFKDVSLKHLLQYHIPTLKKGLLIVQHSYPIRIKGVCAINAPSILDTMYKILEIVLSKKVRKRIHIYSKENMQKLLDVVPEDILPIEFGGKAHSVSELPGLWRKRVENYSDQIKEEDNYISIEELRVGQPKTHSDVFGQEGSFRQLDFD